MIGLLKRQRARKTPAITAADPRSRPHSNENSLSEVRATAGISASAADVRVALAGRLVTLLPSLNEEKYARVYAYTVQALGDLALDEVLKIRFALTGTLRDYAYLPPKAATELVQSVERDISAPILQFCTTLSDHDLMEIIQQHPELLMAQQLRRPPLSTVSEEWLRSIVSHARKFKEGEIPSAKITLPAPRAAELAAMIDASVHDILTRSGHFDFRLTEEITDIFRRRLDRLSASALPGKVDDDVLTDAIALRRTGWVFEGLARLLGLPAAHVKKILESGSPRCIIALCWKAGLSMRTALALQKDIGLISPVRIVYPKGGSDYPLTREEMLWQLEFLGIAKA